MALVRCPECGREKVSDSAEACPDCGYSIKAHFEKIKAEELQKQRQERKLNSITMPTKPQKPFSNLPFAAKFIIGFFVFGIILGIIMKEWFFSIVCIGIIVMFYCIDYSNYNKDLQKYNRAKENFEKYQREELHRQEIEEAVEKLKPRCPHCGSTNINKISTVSREISVAISGLASGMIGKQYKCNKCGHMW